MTAATDPPPAPDPFRDFGFLLKDVARLHALNFERHSSAPGTSATGLTLSQCKVLSHLQRNEGISKVRLAELTDTDPMTLGRLLARMTAEGLVEQRLDPADRRAHKLYLKPDKARPVLHEISNISDHSRADALAGLNAAERSQLMSLLRRIQSNLVALMPGAASGPTTAPHSLTRNIQPCS